MSAWEGSQAQIDYERTIEVRCARVAQVMRENPSLTPQDAREWVAKLEADERAAIKPKCCPCRREAEVVRVNGVLGRCACSCHVSRPR